MLVADADLLIGQALNGKILPKLSEDEVVATELALPVMIGLYLVDEDRSLLSSVPGQIGLLVPIDVEPSHHSPTLNRFFPNGCAHSLPTPGDVAGQTNVH